MVVVCCKNKSMEVAYHVQQRTQSGKLAPFPFFPEGKYRLETGAHAQLLSVSSGDHATSASHVASSPTVPAAQDPAFQVQLGCSMGSGSGVAIPREPWRHAYSARAKVKPCANSS